MGKAWVDVEDKRLSAAVTKLGADKDLKNSKLWTAVAKAVGGGRTGPACLGRWMTAVGTGVTRGNWTAEEDAELLRMFSDPATPSWSTRAVALGKKFHCGVRRGGAETCNRYFALKKAGAAASGKSKTAKKAPQPPAKKKSR